MEQLSNTVMCTVDELNSLIEEGYKQGYAAGKKDIKQLLAAEREQEAKACRDMFITESVSWILLDEHLNAIRAPGD